LDRPQEIDAAPSIQRRREGFTSRGQSDNVIATEQHRGSGVQNENLYTVFGQILVFAVLALIVCSVYWTLHGLMGLSSGFVGDRSSLLFALAGIVLLLLLARRSVTLALLAVLVIAGADRAYFGDDDYALVNSVIAGICFLIATVMFIGALSERVKFANKALPQVLMVVLGLVFLIPAGLIAKVLSVLRIVPRKSDGE
jgi:hypothetical protein